MTNEEISLKFYGRDFSLISKDLNETIQLTNERILNRNEQVRLIIKFLDSIENVESLVVNTNQRKQNSNDKNKLYSNFNGDYYWSGLVGVFQGILPVIYENELKDPDDIISENIKYENIHIKIQICSRFDVDKFDVISKPYFMSTMLLQCRSTVSEHVVSSNIDDYFFDLLLIYLFKEKANICYEKGIYKTYHRFEKNDDKLKGNIDISRHIKMNMGMRNGKVAYSYRENTIDNSLNLLILRAFEVLRKKYPETMLNVIGKQSNSNFKYLINTLKSNISDTFINTKTLISKNILCISHPYYVEYEELRKISLKILRSEGISMFDGSYDDVNGILLYIPDLWELYLEYLLKDSKYKVYSQGYKDSAVKIWDYNDSKTYKQKTYPDYVFSTEIQQNTTITEVPFMTLDAKFKPEWARIIEEEKSISSELSDYDKCVRDMNSLNVHACGTIFPTNIEFVSGLENVIKHNISVFNNIDKFYTFPITIPFISDNLSYSEWLSTFKNNYLFTFDIIKREINKEKEFTIQNYSMLENINRLIR